MGRGRARNVPWGLGPKILDSFAGIPVIHLFFQLLRQVLMSRGRWTYRESLSRGKRKGSSCFIVTMFSSPYFFWNVLFFCVFWVWFTFSSHCSFTPSVFWRTRLVNRTVSIHFSHEAFLFFCLLWRIVVLGIVVCVVIYGLSQLIEHPSRLLIFQPLLWHLGVIIQGLSFYITCCFSFVTFKILSLFCIFHAWFLSVVERCFFLLYYVFYGSTYSVLDIPL